MDVASGKENFMVHFRTGQVGDQHAEGDGNQQQRLKLLDNAQIQQHAGHGDHDEAFPVAVLCKLIESRAGDKIQDRFHTRLPFVIR